MVVVLKATQFEAFNSSRSGLRDRNQIGSKERRQVQFEFTQEIKDRLHLIERKIDSNTNKLETIEDNILGDLLPSILREVRDLRRDLRS